MEEVTVEASALSQELSTDGSVRANRPPSSLAQLTSLGLDRPFH